jgi:hypothetical protein
MKKIIALAFCLVAAPACQSNSVPELDSAPPTPQVAPSSVAVVRGYHHAVDRSRFRIGDFNREVVEHGLRRFVGSEGVFAIHEDTGDAIAIPNADARVNQVPCSLSVEAHNRTVVTYFAAAGVPRDQMGTPHVTTLHRGVSAVDAIGYDPKTRDFAGYTTHIGRVIDGILVEESTAWARINDEGEVVGEEVRWPDIPVSVVVEAKALAKALEDDENRATLHGVIGTQNKGRVVIHHATWSAGPGFAPFASYDVLDTLDAPADHPDARARARHFQKDGAEIVMPTFEADPAAKTR